jgi:outer membrane protein assembly factor BamE (lipoprotein component of BamABCDE complex)
MTVTARRRPNATRASLPGSISARWRRALPRGLVACAALLLAACAQYDSERGVDVSWHEANMAQFERGVTTRADVMATLGPPSQLVSLGEETVLYYLNEDAAGRGLILLLYNRFEVATRYDRAVFIFDAEGRLQDFAGHIGNDSGD